MSYAIRVRNDEELNETIKHFENLGAKPSTSFSIWLGCPDRYSHERAIYCEESFILAEPISSLEGNYRIVNLSDLQPEKPICRILNNGPADYSLEVKGEDLGTISPDAIKFFIDHFSSLGYEVREEVAEEPKFITIIDGSNEGVGRRYFAIKAEHGAKKHELQAWDEDELNHYLELYKNSNYQIKQ